MAAAKKVDNKRSSIRFTPDLGDYAALCFRKTSSEFRVDSLGIIINESATGCAIVIPQTKKLQEGDKFVVQVGKLNPCKAVVVWRKEIDKDVVKLGIKYEE